MVFSRTKSRLIYKHGMQILYLNGSPFEMGLQHGQLLKKQILSNITKHLNVDTFSQEELERLTKFTKAIPSLLSHIPKRYKEEMEGLAEGANISFHEVLLLNLFPELFHCCGITASGSASHDGSLYHARVLDYAAGKSLHKSATLILAEPDEGHCFLHATYAGFIGCITGMNSQKISIGEIGGKGYGSWDGMPMSFILRLLLEETSSLQQAQNLLQDIKRTCEYYYIVSDGKKELSFFCYATAKSLLFFPPGEDYSITQTSKEDDLIIKQGKSVHPTSLFFPQKKDTLLLTGYSYPERYPTLLKRVEHHWGHIDEKALMEILLPPVSRESNLHNVIFHPSSLRLWFAHATETGPASLENYHEFSLEALRNAFF